VSALGQVISLNVRSAIPKDLPEELVLQLAHPLDKVVLPASAATTTNTAGGDGAEGSASTADTAAVSTAQDKGKKTNKGTAGSVPTAPKDKVIQEMDYVSMLNRALPDEIRVLGWCPVTDDFSARFSASHRTYRYFFLRGGLDVAAMQQAAQLLVGEHDFRNLCKLDIGNVTNFRREVYYAKVVPFNFTGSMANTTDSSELSSDDSDGANGAEAGGPDAVYMLEISGIAFLWHMVRAIMAVLFMVGEGLEAPSVVTALLDVAACPGKPPYTLADELPLVLHQCGFDRLVIPAQPRHLWQLTAHYRAIREGHLLAAARAQNSLEHLLGKPLRVGDVREFAEGLRQQQARHARNLQGSKAAGANASNGGRGGSGSGANPHKRRKVEPSGQPSSGTTAVGAEGSTSAESNAASSAADATEPAAALWEAQDTTAANVDQEVQWAAVMLRLEGQLGYTPQVKYVPHVPLMQVTIDVTLSSCCCDVLRTLKCALLWTAVMEMCATQNLHVYACLRSAPHQAI
jgi:tRNA U38,U39,U40 pseudouridine synthase TruA